jgi:hypothetical protein
MNSKFTAHVLATVVQGHGVASGRAASDRRFPDGTIKLQKPHFKECGLDFDTYFDHDYVNGTLNLSIAPLSFEIKNPEFVFRGIKWTDIFPPENFFLSPAKILFKEKACRALLYIPDPATKPDHFQQASTLEVIAQRIPGIKAGEQVALYFNAKAIHIYKGSK